MAPDSISDRANSKIYRGSMPPDSPSVLHVRHFPTRTSMFPVSLIIINNTVAKIAICDSSVLGGP